MWKYCPSLAEHGFTVLLAALAFPGISQFWRGDRPRDWRCFFLPLAYLALRNRQDFLAGLAIGCLIFKPQLGLAAAVVFIFTKQMESSRWRNPVCIRPTCDGMAALRRLCHARLPACPDPHRSNHGPSRAAPLSNTFFAKLLDNGYPVVKCRICPLPG